MSAPTRGLLAAGALAAPLWTIVVLAQASTRSGYDLTRHPASVLANGDLGWIQTSNFLVAGALTLAGAVGLRRALRPATGATWAPILLAVEGFGLLVAAFFPMDPVDGFPPRTPTGQPDSLSETAVVHNIAGSLAFLSLIGACFVLSRRFASAGQRRWAIAGRAAAVLFALGLAWALAGGRAGSLSLFLGVVAAWSWVAGTNARMALTRDSGPPWQITPRAPGRR